MFLLFCVAVLFAVVALLGGRLSRLGRLRMRAPWLLMVALGLQLLITEVLQRRAPGWLDALLHVLSYLLAAGFLVLNRKVPGLLLLGAGAAMNGVVIALNGGELPARAAALRAAHIHQTAGTFANSGHLEHPTLGWLGDVAATPAWLPFQNVISIGDITILAGAAWLCVATCGTWRSRRLAAQPPVPAQVSLPA
jgi:hypothetical protein